MAAASALSLVELRTVLSNPERFGLAEHVWYAIDAPQFFVDENPRHSLAERLDSSAERLALLVDLWLSAAGKPFLLSEPKQVRTLQQELNTREMRMSLVPLEVSLTRTRSWRKLDGGEREMLRIR